MQGGEHPGTVVWPKGYLIVLAISSFIMPIDLAGQLISLLGLIGLIYFSLRSIKMWYGLKANQLYFLLIGLAFSPYLYRISISVMADMFALFCMMAGLSYLIRYHQTSRWKHFWLALFFLSYSGFSRFAALVPLAPLVLWLMLIAFQRRLFLHYIALIVPCILLALHLFLEGGGSDFISHHFIQAWSPLNYFKSSFVTLPELQLPNVTYALPNLLFYSLILFHPGFYWLLAPLLCYALIKRINWLRQTPLFVWLSLLGYVLFLSGITFQGTRYIAFVFPLLLIVLAPLFVGVNDWFGKGKHFLLPLLTLIQLSLCIYGTKSMFEMNKTERLIAQAIVPYQGKTLYAFEIDIALQQRGLNFNYLSLWEKEYTRFEQGALVLFNENRTAKSFEGKNPMNNWNKLTRIKLLDTYYGGWKLYEIE